MIILAPSRKPFRNISRSLISEISRLQSLYFSMVSFCASVRVAVSFSSFLFSNFSSSVTSLLSFAHFSFGTMFPYYKSSSVFIAAPPFSKQQYHNCFQKSRVFSIETFSRKLLSEINFATVLRLTLNIFAICVCVTF